MDVRPGGSDEATNGEGVDGRIGPRGAGFPTVATIGSWHANGRSLLNVGDRAPPTPTSGATRQHQLRRGPCHSRLDWRLAGLWGHNHSNLRETYTSEAFGMRRTLSTNRLPACRVRSDGFPVVGTRFMRMSWRSEQDSQHPAQRLGRPPEQLVTDRERR